MEVAGRLGERDYFAAVTWLYIPIGYTGCHHQNDSCIKMGSEECHFNVPLIVRDKVTRQCPQTTTVQFQSVKTKNLI